MIAAQLFHIITLIDEFVVNLEFMRFSDPKCNHEKLVTLDLRPFVNFSLISSQSHKLHENITIVAMCALNDKFCVL